MSPKPILTTLAVLLHAATLAAGALTTRSTSTCNNATLDTSTYLYPVTVAGTTISDIAKATGRGVCDIGRHNIMADVTIVPNVGQTIVIPPQVCDPDEDSCLLEPGTRDCILGGPRLYYTVNGDTYDKIAARLNVTVDSIASGPGSSSVNTSAELTAGQFVKVPLCSPSQCVFQPFTFDYGVYKDLAEEYGTTVGQIMMLSPTYNYSTFLLEGGNSAPTIVLPINCTLLSSNYTVLS